METQEYIQDFTGANLVLFYNNKIFPIGLEGKSQMTIGNPKATPAPDIPINSDIVSRQHGLMTGIQGQWFYTDIPTNKNGTYYNGRKIEKGSKPVPLNHGDILRIDSEDLNAVDKRGVMILFLTSPMEGQWKAYNLGQRSCVIGRDPQRCQITEDKPYFSAVHAEVAFKNGTYMLHDLDSMAGTYMNGRAIRGFVPLRERDSFAICDKIYIFADGNILYTGTNRSSQQKYPAGVPAPGVMNRNQQEFGRANRRAPIILHADIMTKQVKNNSGHGMKELIRDVHLDIRQGSLVALLGTAGAGKSTVMNCLNGMDLTGVEGRVLFKNVDLMRDFDQMKFLIGSVPQKKVFHPTFTPEQEFTFAAIMRLPADTAKSEIQQRVDHTIKMLGMNNVRNNKNVKLSGGEQSRVNVGIELVADRELLCLDEPDAGLSPNLKHELFVILRDLAHTHNKSVLTIIHDVSEIDLFDQVIMMVKVDNVGRLAFSGTPEEARKYFGCDVRDVYAKLEANPERYVRR